MGDFKDRLIEAMRFNNVTQAELSAKTGLSKPRISQYVNGVYEAKQDALLKLSRALDVDIAWLMGYDVPIELNSATNDELQEPKDEQKLLSNYRQLNESGKEEALKRVEEMTEMKKYIQ